MTFTQRLIMKKTASKRLWCTPRTSEARDLVSTAIEKGALETETAFHTYGE